MTKVILHDELTALYLPATLEGDYRLLPAFTGVDEWHSILPIIDLNIWEDDGEVQAALYLCRDGDTLTDECLSVLVIDKRTKPEPEPESVEQTIERLMDTIEQLSSHAQFIINMMENRDCVDSLQRDLNAIINKHQRSY